jgi:hypothetical protein
MYWSYSLIYVDDMFCVHRDPGTTLAKLDDYFKMKEGSIQVPTFYLDTNIEEECLVKWCGFLVVNSSKYIQSAVQNMQEYLAALSCVTCVIDSPV